MQWTQHLKMFEDINKINHTKENNTKTNLIQEKASALKNLDKVSKDQLLSKIWK